VKDLVVESKPLLDERDGLLGVDAEAGARVLDRVTVLKSVALRTMPQRNSAERRASNYG
jgi:hypothetical protein